MVDFGGNCFWRHCRDPNSTARNSTRARRRRVRLCRPTHVARDPPLQACLQHEVSRNLCCLRRDHVDLWTNNRWNSLGFTLGECRDGRTHFSSGSTIGKYDGRDCCGSELCRALCEPFCAGLRWSRDTFCDAARAWWDAAPARRIGSASVRPTIRERIALWRWTADETACVFFRFIWSDLSRMRGYSSIYAKHHRPAKSDLRRWRNSALRNHLFPSLAHRRIQPVLVLDNRLRVPIWQFSSSLPSVADSFSERQRGHWCWLGALGVCWDWARCGSVEWAIARQRTISAWATRIFGVGAMSRILLSIPLFYPGSSSSFAACRRCHQQTVGARWKSYERDSVYPAASA